MITIIQNEDKSFDLFDSKKQENITNESFDEIIGTRNFFVVNKSQKFGAYCINGTCKAKCKFDNFEYSPFSKSLILISKTDICFNYVILSKFGIYSKTRINFWNELSTELQDGSHVFILKIGEYDKEYSYLWNNKKGLYKFIADEIIEIAPGLLKVRNKIEFKLFNFLENTPMVGPYKKITSFEIEQRIITKKEFSYQIRDFSSNLVSDIHFKYIASFTNGASIAELKNQTGLIDINGKWISGYDDLDSDVRWWQYYDSPFKEGFVLIKKDNLYGLVNINEKLHFQPIAQNLIIFHLGFAPVQIENGNWGIIDTNLNWVVEPTLLEMKFCFESYNDVEDYITSIGLPFIAQSPKTKKYGLITYDGNWVCEPKYDKINANDFYYLPHKYLFYLKFELDEYKGVINIHGKEIFKEKIEWRKFDDFDEFEFNLEEFRFDLDSNYMKLQLPKNYIYFLVKKDNQDGYYDANGNYFIGNPKIINDQNFF
jgi:hypothetical protein